MGSTDILFTTDTTDVSSSVARCALLKIKVYKTSQIQFQPARSQIFDVVAKAQVLSQTTFLSFDILVLCEFLAFRVFHNDLGSANCADYSTETESHQAVC